MMTCFFTSLYINVQKKEEERREGWSDTDDTRFMTPGYIIRDFLSACVFVTMETASIIPEALNVSTVSRESTEL